MLVNPDEPLDVQVERQARIIDALMRRANRQDDVRPSAFRAFQSAIELQEKMQAQGRDLARAVSELETVRGEQERMRKSLVAALSSMEGGFALFIDGKLELCNHLFLQLFPDISNKIDTGLSIGRFFARLVSSKFFRSADRNLATLPSTLEKRRDEGVITSVMIEMADDRWFQLSAQHTSGDNVVLLLTEITDFVRRNRSEKESLIDRQEDYLKAVFQTLTSGVCTFSSRGKVLMHNGQFRELLGLPASYVAEGEPVTALVEYLFANGLAVEGDAVNIEAIYRKLVTEGAFRQRVRLGPERVLELHMHEMPDSGYLVEVEDVTLEARATETLERRVMERTAELTRANEKLTEEYEKKARVEEALRDAKDKAEKAVSSKTRFLAAASHDLLQPINAAKLLISTLLETSRGTDMHGMVERLEGSFRSTEQLLHLLLDISRLESAAPDTVSPLVVNLTSMMNSIHADQSLVAEQKNVSLKMVPCSVLVRSDPVYLLRSIQNLVVNAIQYTQPGGRVLVGCRRRKGRVVLEVWDTGIGIPKRDQQRVFEEFARADGEKLAAGVGLGLSVVERACRLLGHKLSVKSKPGVGSVFRIELETVTDAPAVNEPLSLASNADDLLENQIVLLIENDDDVLFGTTKRLEQWGADVLACRSIDEAVTCVEDMGMAPDIILADYTLDDDETGVDAIGRVRKLTKTHVPAILITADRSPRVRAAGLTYDISVIYKPVKLNRLRPLMAWKIGQQGDADGQGDTKVAGDSAAGAFSVWPE